MNSPGSPMMQLSLWTPAPVFIILCPNPLWKAQPQDLCRDPRQGSTALPQRTAEERLPLLWADGHEPVILLCLELARAEGPITTFGSLQAPGHHSGPVRSH